MGEFSILYKKNFLIWSRNKCGCLCEVLTTIIFGLILMLIYSLSEDNVKKKTSYLEHAAQIGPLPESVYGFPANHQKAFENLLSSDLFGKGYMK